MVEQAPYAHDAFISYSRRDRAFATALQRALSDFRLPADLSAPSRRLRIFRDEEDFTGVEYYKSLDRHLRDSRKLIVICSPDARASPYVNDEITRFAEIRGAAHIIPVLLRGVPNMDADPDRVSEAAFPDALSKTLQAPLAVDYRDFDPDRHKASRGVFAGPWYTLLANIYELGRADIEQRDRRRQQRTRRYWTAAATASTVILIGLTAWALVSRQEALARRKEAEQQRDIAMGRQALAQAQLLAAQRVDLLPQSVRLGLEALRRAPGPEAEFVVQRGAALLARPIVRMGQSARINAIAFSADGRYLASALENATATVLEIATRREPARLRHGGRVLAIAFHPKQPRLATAADDGIRLWDIEAGGPETTHWESPNPVGSIAFNNDGTLLVTAHWDGTILVRTTDGRSSPPASMKHGMVVNSISVSRDGRYLASGSNDRTARVWALPAGREIARLTHDNGVLAVALSTDGRYLATGDWDGTARLWRVADRVELTRLDHASPVTSVALSGDGQYLATASENNVARLWEVASGQEIQRMTHEAGVTAVAFSSDSQILATGSEDKTIALWKPIDSRQYVALPHPDDIVVAAVPGPDGRSLVTASGGHVRVWDLESRRETARMTHGDRVVGIALTRDGRQVASAGQDETARLWDTASGAEVLRIPHPRAVNAVAFSPDGRRLATGSHDNHARVWDLPSGRLVTALEHPDPVHFVVSVAFSPDGRQLATGGSDGVRVWDVARAQPTRHYPASGETNSVSFSPDGKHLATAGADGAARVMELFTGKEIARLGLSQSVQDIGFSPDGRYLATASADRTVRVWELTSGQEVARQQYGGKANSVRFSRDGRYLASSNSDRVARVWRWRIDDVVREACSRLERNFTNAEWQHFFGFSEPYRRTCDTLPVADSN